MTNQNIIEKICCGKFFSTQKAEKIGVSTVSSNFIIETLFRTPKGEFFLTSETKPSDEYIYANDSHLYDGRTNISTISKNGAYEWVKEQCPEALTRLKELGIPEDNRELIPLLDIRRGVYGEKDYTHHVIYKLADGSGYVVASNEEYQVFYPTRKEYLDESTGDVVDVMYLHDMTDDEVRGWAECALSVDTYIKCFGPIETA